MGNFYKVFLVGKNLRRLLTRRRGITTSFRYENLVSENSDLHKCFTSDDRQSSKRLKTP